MSSIFDPVYPYLDPVERDMLRRVIIMRERTYASYTKELGGRSRVDFHQLRLLSMLKHPYFGIGQELNGKLAWQERAQCAKERFSAVVLPETGRPQKGAVEICGRCAVREECADLASSSQPRVTTGIWAGRGSGAYQT